MHLYSRYAWNLCTMWAFVWHSDRVWKKKPNVLVHSDQIQSNWFSTHFSEHFFEILPFFSLLDFYRFFFNLIFFCLFWTLFSCRFSSIWNESVFNPSEVTIFYGLVVFIKTLVNWKRNSYLGLWSISISKFKANKKQMHTDIQHREIMVLKDILFIWKVNQMLLKLIPCHFSISILFGSWKKPSLLLCTCFWCEWCYWNDVRTTKYTLAYCMLLCALVYNAKNIEKWIKIHDIIRFQWNKNGNTPCSYGFHHLQIYIYLSISRSVNWINECARLWSFRYDSKPISTINYNNLLIWNMN